MSVTHVVQTCNQLRRELQLSSIPNSSVLHQHAVLKLLQSLARFVTDGSGGMQACADKLERELQLYCDPSKPGSLPVFPDEEPDAAVSSISCHCHVNWHPLCKVPLDVNQA